MDFHSMKRNELQALCKKHKIPANLKNVEMANRLASLLKIDDEKPQEQRLKPCLKVSDNDKVKEAKKVRISPLNQTFEIEKTNPRAMRLAYRTRKSMISVEDKINYEEKASAVEDPVPCAIKASENVAVDEQVRSTRTRGRKKALENVAVDEQVKSTRTRGRNPKQAEVEVLPKKKAQESEVNKRQTGRRTSCVADLLAGRPEKSVKNTASEAKPVVRRSARNADKHVDSVEQVEIVKVPKRKTRSDCLVNKGEEKAPARCLRRNTSKDTGEKAVEEAKEQERESAKVTRNARRQTRGTWLNETVSATERASVVQQCQRRRSTLNAPKTDMVEPEELKDKKSEHEVQEKGVSLRSKQTRKKEKTSKPGKADVHTKCVGKRQMSTVKHAEDLQIEPSEKSVDSVDISEAVDIQKMVCNEIIVDVDAEDENQSQHRTSSSTLLLEECESRNAEERSGGSSSEMKQIADEFSNVQSAKQTENSDDETTKAAEKDVHHLREEEYNEADILNGGSSEDAETVIVPTSGFKSPHVVSTVSRSFTEDSKVKLENSTSKVGSCVQSDTPLTSTSIHTIQSNSQTIHEETYANAEQNSATTNNESALMNMTDAQVSNEPVDSQTDEWIDQVCTHECENVVSIQDTEELTPRSMIGEKIAHSGTVHVILSDQNLEANGEKGRNVSYILDKEEVVPTTIFDENMETSKDLDTPMSDRSAVHEEKDRDAMENDNAVMSNKPELMNMTDAKPNENHEDSVLADQNLEHNNLVSITTGYSMGNILDLEVISSATVDESAKEIASTSDNPDDTADCEGSHKQGLEKETSSQTIPEEANGNATENDSASINNEPELVDMTDSQLNDILEDVADQKLEGESCRETHEVSGRLDDEAVCMEEAALIGIQDDSTHIYGNSTIKVHSASSSPYNSDSEMELVSDLKKLGEFYSARYNDNLALQQSDTADLNDDALIDEAEQYDQQHFTEMCSLSTDVTEPITMQGCGHMGHTELDSVTPEPQVGDGENFSLDPLKPEEADGEEFSLPEPEETKGEVSHPESEEVDGENFSLDPLKPEEADGEEFSLPEPEETKGEISHPESEEADGENFSLDPLKPEEADGEEFSLPEPEAIDGEKFSHPEADGKKPIERSLWKREESVAGNCSLDEANMNENTENKEHPRQETDGHTFSILRTRLNNIVGDMDEVAMNIEHLLEKQIRQSCEFGMKLEEAISDIRREYVPKDDECKSTTVEGISKEGEIGSSPEMKRPLDNAVEVENSSRKPSSVMNTKKRRIMIHGTPRRPIKAADMKENSTSHIKRERHLGDATALRPLARRKALGELPRV